MSKVEKKDVGKKSDVETVSADNDIVASNAWQTYWNSLAAEEKQGLADMFRQDIIMVKLSKDYGSDPRGTIRISKTTKKDNQGRPIIVCASPDPDVGKDVLGTMATEYTVHNQSTGFFKLEDLTDRKILEEKTAESIKKKAAELVKETEKE